MGEGSCIDLPWWYGTMLCNPRLKVGIFTSLLAHFRNQFWILNLVVVCCMGSATISEINVRTFVRDECLSGLQEHQSADDSL